jgi:hypothetical protein
LLFPAAGCRRLDSYSNERIRTRHRQLISGPAIIRRLAQPPATSRPRHAAKRCRAVAKLRYSRSTLAAGAGGTA